MYYLINKLDNSYNCHSEQPFPDFMKEDSIQIEYEGLLPDIDISLCYYDFDNSKFYAEENVRLMTQEEIDEQELQAQEYEESARLAAQNEMLNAVLDKLRPVLTEEQLDSIGNFNTTSDEDVANIEGSLNDTTST